MYVLSRNRLSVFARPCRRGSPRAKSTAARGEPLSGPYAPDVDPADTAGTLDRELAALASLAEGSCVSRSPIVHWDGRVVTSPSGLLRGRLSWWGLARPPELRRWKRRVEEGCGR